jgi:RNA polymerase sigma factor (sigma-70 family)
MKTAPNNRLRQILDSLHSALDGLSDGQLLARFMAGQDELAFARLVRVHGPMVMTVCKRVLQHAQDAEDAFQATFLILARKGRTVVHVDALAGWLYRVAYRTAMEARAMRARRREREKQVDAVPHPEIPPAESRDWQAVLDHELSRLPQKYQTAIVLCDLEARSRRDAALQLGIAEGTLSSRLAYGRKLLAARLARRGVTLGAGALAAALSDAIASAAVPWPLVSKTAKAAAIVAAGQLAAVSAPVAGLMKGVLKAMFLTKLKSVAGFVVLGAIALGLGGAALQTVGAQNAPGANPAKPANELDALRRENELLKLNLLVVLEKVKSLQAEVHTLKNPVLSGARVPLELEYYEPARVLVRKVHKQSPPPSVEDALKWLREAKADYEKRKTGEAFEKAVQELRIELGLKKKAAPPKE